MLRSVLQRHWDKPHWLPFILKISCHSCEAVKGNLCLTGVGNRSSEMCLRNKKELIFSIFLTVDQFWILQGVMKQRRSSRGELEDEELLHTYSSSATVPCPALVYWEKTKYWFLFLLKECLFGFTADLHLLFSSDKVPAKRSVGCRIKRHSLLPPCERRWRGLRSSGWQSQSN